MHLLRFVERQKNRAVFETADGCQYSIGVQSTKELLTASQIYSVHSAGFGSEPLLWQMDVSPDIFAFKDTSLTKGVNITEQGTFDLLFQRLGRHPFVNYFGQLEDLTLEVG